MLFEAVVLLLVTVVFNLKKGENLATHANFLVLQLTFLVVVFHIMIFWVAWNNRTNEIDCWLDSFANKQTLYWMTTTRAGINENVSE